MIYFNFPFQNGRSHMDAKVEQRLEKFAPTFEQLIKLEIFTEPEVKDIIKKRKSYEYSLQSKSATLDTYLSYIQYETAVMALTEKRKLEKGIDSNQRLLSDIDWPLHIHSIYRNAIQHFGQSDIKIWNLYFDFCLSNNDFKNLSQAFARCLRLHRQNADLWIRAATWEMTDNGNPEEAKDLMARAIKELPNQPKLYSMYAETIFFIAQQIKGRREIHGIENQSDSTKAPYVIYEKALSSCKPDSIEVYKLFKGLFEKYEQPTNELTNKAIETGDAELLDYIAVHESSSIDEIDQKFKEFLQKFPDSQPLLIKYGIFLGKDKKDPQELIKIVDQIKDFDDKETEIFVELLLDNNCIEDADDLLQDDLSTPKLQLLKLRLMSMQEKDDDQFIKNSKIFLLKHNNTFELNSNFLLLLQLRQPPIDENKFYNLVIERASFLSSDDAAKIFEYSFIKYGKQFARKMMDKLLKIINPTPKFIETAIKIEENPEDDGKFDPAKVRALHELNVSKWGNNNTDVWINYCAFEFKQKNIQRLESIRRKAENSLDDSSEFNRRYHNLFCKKQKA